MDNLFDTVKAILITTLAAIITYLEPIQGSLIGILALLALNFVVGLGTGYIVEHESFSFSKFKVAAFEGAFFLGLLSFTYFLGRQNGNPKETASCISAITYIIIYCYAINMLKNTRKWIINKDSSCKMVLDILYYILTVEFIKKFPAFDKYKDNSNKTNKIEDGK